jgi:hypothetical protein
MTVHVTHDPHARLIDRLHDQARDIARLTRGLDDAMLARRTVEGKWSVKELACHCDRLQDVFGARIESMLEADRPAVQSYEPEHDAVFASMLERPTADIVLHLLNERERLAAKLMSLDKAHWHRAGAHPKFPSYDVHFAVEYMVHHEAHHIYQMFERRIPLGPIPH